jgi:hypothetical protein
VSRQFRDLKFGDRFYYENGHDVNTRFQLPQLNEIRKVTMSKLICDNLDIESIQRNAFLPISPANPLISCKSLPPFDLSKWKNEPLPKRKN